MLGRRVLVVEDDVDCRLAIRTALDGVDGYAVVGEADTGERGAELAAQLAPDIVILDIGLPDISGIDLIPRLRERPVPPQIVVFSGSATAPQAAAADRFVPKTGSVRRLLAALVELRAADRDASIALERDPASARAARSFVERKCHEWGFPDRADDVVLVVSELVTNAVVHGASDTSVRLVATLTSLRLEVTDRSPGSSPAPTEPDDMAESGRGLFIVDNLADGWGIDDVPEGKSIWATFTAGAATTNE